MKAKSAVAAVVLGGRAAEGLIFNPPHCALPGLQVLLIFLKKIEATSNLAVGRLELALELLLEPLVAWLRQVTSLLAKISPATSCFPGGASTLATCPSLAITTLAGSGMIGPAAPLVALLTGALLGGVAGGTAGGVYTCKVVVVVVVVCTLARWTSR